MVEQRPFKALVEGSSPSQPTRSKYSVKLITGMTASYWANDDCEWIRPKTPNKSDSTPPLRPVVLHRQGILAARPRLSTGRPFHRLRRRAGRLAQMFVRPFNMR